MSITATSWAWNQTLKPTLKLVLMAICDCHNQSTGRCDPSYEFIAEKASISRATAIRMIQVLVDQGYVSLLNSKAENGQQRTNSYILHIEKAEYQNDTQCESRVSKTVKPSITVDTRNEPEEPEVKIINAGARLPKKATRVPEDFQPTATCHRLAESLGVSVTADFIEAFKDYWRGVAGSKGLKMDWPGTFRNQIRFAAKQQTQVRQRHANPSRPNTIAHGFEIIDAAFAARERELFGPEGSEGIGRESLKLVS